MNKSSLTDITKASAESLSQSSQATTTAVQELAKAYQELAAKNAKSLAASIQALASVKTPAEFFTIQQKLLKESLETSAQDSKHIAELTAAVFTAAFEPLKKQFETARKG